jgi:hypothetical protein
MGNSSQQLSRGSEWHRWEPHIHAPGTVLADQYPKKDAWDPYLNAVELVSPALRAIGVTDYCIPRSYERVKAFRDKGRLKDCELLFSPYLRQFQPHPYPDLPLDLKRYQDEGVVVPQDIAKAASYRELLSLLQAYGKAGLEEMRAINPITRGKAAEEINRDD